MTQKNENGQDKKGSIELRTGILYARLIAHQRLFAEAVGHRFGVDTDNIIPTAGATGAIEAVRNHVFKKSGKRHPIVLTVSPGYWRARESFEGGGFGIVSVSTEQKDFSIEESKLIEQVNRISPDLVYLSLPNNPTGAIFDPEIIIEAACEDVTVMIDLTLPSRELDSGALLRSLYDRFKGRKNLFIVCSTSKSHETAEHRIGWATCTALENARALISENRNSVSTISIREGMRQLEESPTVLGKIDESYSLLEEGARSRGFEIVKPLRMVKSGYVLVKLYEHVRDNRKVLEEAGIQVMWGSEIGLTDQYIRLELTEPSSVKAFTETFNGSGSILKPSNQSKALPLTMVNGSDKH
jgi:aspartate/methionine/tyrosine aminotransferase